MSVGDATTTRGCAILCGQNSPSSPIPHHHGYETAMRLSEHHIWSLILLFISFKAVLLSVAIISPGSGYDTSTHLLGSKDSLHSTSLYTQLPAKLIRWDAIYFVTTAKRGYVYEQEWAFGWGWSKLITLCAAFVPSSSSSLIKEAWAGIVLAHISHLLSVLVLYRLAKLLQPPGTKNHSFALIAAALHVIAPGGIFLSAPYGESLFSLLNFSGTFAYCLSRKSNLENKSKGVLGDLYLVIAGVLFGVAATVRSNSIFNGIVFAYDLMMVLPRLPTLLSNFSGIRYLGCLIAAGLLLAAGFVAPQTIAYVQYCSPQRKSLEPLRIWCKRVPPSIYAFVQDHYWKVGFLRYWTISNSPLFVLAVPMLSILFYTGWKTVLPVSLKKDQFKKLSYNTEFSTTCLKRIAVPQIILAILALTTFHVQVITRVASGYPLPYLWISSAILENSAGSEPKQRINILQVTVRFMVIYAVIQGGLFASFLPPA